MVFHWYADCFAPGMSHLLGALMRHAILLVLVACDSEPTPPAAPAPAPAPAPVAATPAPTPAPAPAAAPAAVAGDAEAGKAVYTQHCQACHQADGTGMGGMLAADFKADDGARLKKNDADLLTSISKGFTGSTGTMPPWEGTLSEAGMANVLAHIRATYGE
jgi:mono/diheme cytochrome c family protein